MGGVDVLLRLRSIGAVAAHIAIDDFHGEPPLQKRLRDSQAIGYNKNSSLIDNRIYGFYFLNVA